MPVISTEGLTRSYGASVVLDRVDLTIRRGERVGLVGANGSGKSTLSRILAGLEEPDSGQIARRRGARIEYLAQEPHLDPEATVLDTVLSGLTTWNSVKAKYDQLSEKLATADGDPAPLLEQQAELAGEIERLGGWDRSSEARAVVTKLGIDNLDQKIGTMSGGERRRVALARILVADPDLTVLDEPTNHLDAETIEWLETYLLERHRGALLLITHDRYVLDRVVQRTIEIDQGKLFSYDGGWEDYLLARSERLHQEARTEANRQNFLRREIEWLRRQPKARTGKQKARIQRAETAQQAEPTRASRDFTVELAETRLGNKIVEAHEIALDIGGRRVVADLTLHLTRGQRIGIIGRNGAGKTTLLRGLLGDLEPAQGSVVIGKNTTFAYFDQQRSGLVDDESILENVADGHASVTVAGDSISSYSYLERFGFRGDRIRQPVGSLSGGERARVVLAKLLRQPANVLVLDEPTNDLDVTTLGAIEDMLLGMNGTALIVSHDRYFLDRVATSLLVVHGDGRVIHHPGGYSAYAETRERERAAEKAERAAERAAPEAAPTPTKAASAKKKGLTYREKLELEGLLEKVAEAEARVEELEGKLADPALYSSGSEADRTEAARLEEELLKARADAERLGERWLELEEKKGE